jgi:hypothetical protein
VQRSVAMTQKIDDDQLTKTMRVLLEIEEERRQRAQERILGLKAIGSVIGAMMGMGEKGITDETVMKLAQKNGLPLDWTPGIGYSIQRCWIERWIQARTKAVEKLRARKRPGGR